MDTLLGYIAEGNKSITKICEEDDNCLENKISISIHSNSNSRA